MARASALLLLFAAGAAAFGRPQVLKDAHAERMGLVDPKYRVAANALLTEFSALMRPWSNRLDAEASVNVKDDPNPLKLTMLDDGEGGARCLDGSPYGLYHRPAPADSKHPHDWVIFLQGGGLCITSIDCAQRTKEALGSSKYFNPNHSDVDNILNTDPAANPFADFNHAWLPYCSGDTHVGTQTAKNPYGLYFAGALNFDASVARLLKDFGLGTAERVILSGASAGGIGTHNLADALQAKLPAAAVSAMPMAGQFFPKHVELMPTQLLRVLDILSPEVDINSFFSMVVADLYDARLPEPCASTLGAADAFRCWDAATNYDYVQAPTLWIQNMYDQLQIEDVMLCIECSKWNKQYIAYFGQKMRETYARAPTASARRNNVWLQACYDHTTHLCLASGTTINNATLNNVVGAWFFDGDNTDYVDPCADSASSQPCNPTCSARVCSDL